MLNRNSIRKIADFAQFALIYGWLSLLQPVANTDTFYSVYIMLALLAVVCQKKLHQKWVAPQVKLGGGGLSLAAVLSLLVVSANYQLLETGDAVQSETEILILLTSALVLFLGGICVAYPIICYVAEFFGNTATSQPAKHPGRIFAVSFLFITLVDLGYLFGVRYPGILTRDSVSTLKQILGISSYNNVMPYWHTKFVQSFFRLGMWITGNINGAVATFHVAQILMMAGCLSFAVVTVYQSNAPKWVVLALFVFYALTPYHIAYSVTLWKDVLFAVSLLLMTVALYRILRGIGKKQRINQLLAIIGATGFSLLRTNGWYALAVTIIVMIIANRGRIQVLQKQLLLVVLATWIMLNPLLKVLHVNGIDLVEAFAVPMQQVARVVSQERELEEDDLRLLEKIFDVEKMADVYTPETVDPVKFKTFYYDQKEFITQNWSTYLRLYLKIGKQYPGDYWKAWVDLTKGFWNAGYTSYIYDSTCEGEELGIHRSGEKSLAVKLYVALFLIWENMVPLQFTASMGLFIWILLVLTAVAFLKNWKEKILFIPLIVLAVGLWLGTPVSTEFRYGYPFALCIPFLLCVCGFASKESVAETSAETVQMEKA